MMPLRIQYTYDGQGIEVTALGQINPREIIEAYKEIYCEKNIKKRGYFLIDRSEAEENDMTSEGIRRIASLDMNAMKINPYLIIAHVAPTDFQFGLTRIWEAHMQETKSIKIFRDRKSAEDWIKKRLEKPIL